MPEEKRKEKIDSLTGSTIASKCRPSFLDILTYYCLQLRNQNRTRRAQLFMQIHDQLNDKELRKQLFQFLYTWKWNDHDDFSEKYGPETNIDVWTSFTAFTIYYEGIGVLVKHGLIDSTLVNDLMSGEIMRTWEKEEPVLKEMIEHLSWPQALEWNKYLYNKLKQSQNSKTPNLKHRQPAFPSPYFSNLDVSSKYYYTN